MEGDAASKRVVSGSGDLNFKRDGMDIKPLFSEGKTVMDFDVLEELLEKLVGKHLQLNAQDTPLIFTENSIHQKELRLKLTEHLFEKFRLPAIFFCKDSVLASFACGRSTALVLDIGNEQTLASPVHDGYTLQKCVLKHDLGGQTISNMLSEWISKDLGQEVHPRYSFKRKFKTVEGVDQCETTPVECAAVTESYRAYCLRQIVNDLKESICYVAEDAVDNNQVNVRTKDFELPDGKQCTIGGQRAQFPEVLFGRNSGVEGFTGIHTMVTEAISRTDIDIRRDLFSGIVLTGGSAGFKNIVERLQKQIPEIAPQNVKVKVIHSADIKHAAWMGGSILSSLGSFQQMWMSRQEYQEHGAIMVERKCP